MEWRMGTVLMRPWSAAKVKDVPFSVQGEFVDEVRISVDGYTGRYAA
ncbi:hypothetical protein M1I95_19140 [Rossellomorea marisflavi]|nr:hypothetical protein [Rossellomorea marisflavi]UTE72354.1 hypothetical protein M1I95_19140 [Rossellomorea marisflavi]